MSRRLCIELPTGTYCWPETFDELKDARIQVFKWQAGEDMPPITCHYRYWFAVWVYLKLGPVHFPKTE